MWIASGIHLLSKQIRRNHSLEPRNTNAGPLELLNVKHIVAFPVEVDREECTSEQKEQQYEDS